jgi:hypothetical protein
MSTAVVGLHISLSVVRKDNKIDKAFLTFCNVKHRGAMKFDSRICCEG